MILAKARSWLRQRIFTPARLERLQDYTTIVIGTAVLVMAMHYFFIPSQLAAGGLTGAAQIVNNYTGWPIGTLVFIGNIPLFLLGWFQLGGKRFLARTIFAATIFSVMLDGMELFFPTNGLTDDFLLNALYGGVLAGVGVGLVLRAKATTGGTDILARFLDKKFGIPISRGYLYTDGIIVFVAAMAFSWEHALYAVIGLYIGSTVTEIAMTGLNVDRVATIITDHPEKVAQQVIRGLERGVTAFEGKGMYTGRQRTMLMIATSRAEINQLKAIVHETDPRAFVIIGQAQEVLGEGFRRLKIDD